jgi:molybdate transport system substrate-binding protein
MLSKRIWTLVLGLALLGLSVADSAMAAAPEVTVFAAASTTNALTDIGKLWEAQGGGKVIFSFASSSTLAKQIEQGAPAQVFLSADQKWMDYLEQRGLLQAGSRRDLLGNRLVLIAPADSALRGKIAAGFPLGAWLGQGRLSVGDPDHVPAGLYTKEALSKLGVWGQVEGRLARAADVRAALALVERGETPLGVVYSTDAAVTAKVRVVDTFPEDSHQPVTYPAALVAGQATEAGGQFFKFLGSAQAQAVWQKYGFLLK